MLHVNAGIRQELLMPMEEMECKFMEGVEWYNETPAVDCNE
jgi:hypothetical protein